MKFRRQASPLLLLLIPWIQPVTALRSNDVLHNEQHTGTRPDIAGIDSDLIEQARKLGAKVPPGSVPSLKAVVGTKDAPVDGQDGKPKTGPWVDGISDTKKTTTDEGVVSNGPKKTAPLPLADPQLGDSIPQEVDGVMNDPNREFAKDGTTGTHGGVSQKDKARLLAEGETGEKPMKIPEQPVEIPELPHSEELKIAEGSAGKISAAMGKKEEEVSRIQPIPKLK
jgi:Ca2+/H+ antiporter, TMEM165/GDT1 family